jgi:hypothetical protein
MPEPPETSQRDAGLNPRWLALWKIVSEEARRLDAREAEKAAAEAEKR